MDESSATDSPMTRVVVSVLEPLLGRFTARKAVELAAEQCETSVEALAPSDAQCLGERLRPVLRTLLGAPTAAEVLQTIAQQALAEETES